MTLGEAIEIHGMGTELERKGSGTNLFFTPEKAIGKVIFGVKSNGTKYAENADDQGWMKRIPDEVRNKTILRKRVDNGL